MRYVCPECNAGGGHPATSPAPLCHKCDFKITMVAYKCPNLSDIEHPMIHAKPDAPIPRIYIAGPMTGIEDLNFPAFHAAAAKYRARGATVLNPAEINPDPGMAWADAMRADIALLVTCDTIVMLDGWTRSRGATLEHHIAVALGMTVVHP